MTTPIDNHSAEVKVRRYSGLAACDVIVRKRGHEFRRPQRIVQTHFGQTQVTKSTLEVLASTASTS
jgi:hypothetical protein